MKTPSSTTTTTTTHAVRQQCSVGFSLHILASPISTLHNFSTVFTKHHINLVMIRVLHFIKMKHHNFPEIKNTYLTFLQIYYRYAVAKLIQINIDFFLLILGLRSNSVMQTQHKKFVTYSFCSVKYLQNLHLRTHDMSMSLYSYCNDLKKKRFYW